MKKSFQKNAVRYIQRLLLVFEIARAKGCSIQRNAEHTMSSLFCF